MKAANRLKFDLNDILYMNDKIIDMDNKKFLVFLQKKILPKKSKKRVFQSISHWKEPQKTQPKYNITSIYRMGKSFTSGNSTSEKYSIVFEKKNFPLNFFIFFRLFHW